MNITTILQRLGYRPLSNDIWVKPFGTSLISYDVTDNIISTIFMGHNNKIYLWDRKTIPYDIKQPEYFESYIVDYESHTRIDVGQPYKWGFLTREQEFNNIL